ncbi:asparagine synthetase domain-containing protein CG17486 [Phlebotomus argentipes]|uniref:asparagine synthetase domain-containing protein CG17486 n=1 Tax=Phlebotomus argentipes TaxID=94469 RepID=UPI002892F984|nr:asparagine synthetase domain-containing protein CG17486 [Phlebotomus argentipes]
MCGIFCLFPRSNPSVNCPGNFGDIYEEHFRDTLNRRGPDYAKSYTFQGIFFAAHVLWHQGGDLCPQPIEDEHGILIFNGDLFMDEITVAKSDTSWLLDALSRCSSSEDVKNLLRILTGPFCFVYYQKSSRSLLFCRDILGRNSLLIGVKEDSVVLTSAGEKSSEYNLIEVPPLGLYEILWDAGEMKISFWDEMISCTNYFLTEEAFLKSHIESKGMKYSSTKDFINPVWLEKHSMEFDYSFKVIFEGISKEPPDQLLQRGQSLIFPVIKKLIGLLETSVRDRVTTTVKRCKNCLRNSDASHCNHAKVGILFSGGIDCSILAILADKFIPRDTGIDLLNVAFEKNTPKGKEIDWNVPDRQSAKEALEELKRVCPERTWNLIEVNVAKEEKTECLTKNVCHLIYPRNTILDESLGVALWFAARAEDNSTCRVLLIGSGADELFGGYTRHRVAFDRGGEESLKQELENDWARLPSRNLARDDRVICDHGVTQRSPFIEERLVSFLLHLQPLQKCFPPLGPGVGDKTLLRICGYHLGLRKTAWRGKKALQFGSRVANSQQNANDISQFLT